MKKDFHYSVIKILARKAGFDDIEAQTIAYASQYVDDASLHLPIKISNPPNFILKHDRYEMKMFDPICTAHHNLDHIRSISRKAQEKVYVSFHFIPDKNFNEIKPIRDKHYITKENGKFVNTLVKKAINELKIASNLERKQKLIKLGMILHSYADTWAHQGFSGIRSPFNDIKDLKLKKDKKRYSNLPSIVHIGHLEARDYPDITNIEWKYRYKKRKNFSNAKIIRKNYDIFFDASKHIFHYLCEANEKLAVDDLWNAFKSDLYYCLKKPKDGDGELKENTFKEKFTSINFEYDENLWKKIALNSEDDADKNNWFYFHIEAYNHRNYIESMIPSINILEKLKDLVF